MLRVTTVARMSEEFRTIWIYSQQVFLQDKLICTLPSRTLNLLTEFTTDQLLLVNEENLNAILSQKLLGDLLKDESVRNILRK
jgi:hypothetical protein